jgi:YidC/Oxa1 family membrane protein insertase
MQNLFSTVIYDPIYNALAFLVGVVPGGDIGIAIIILTIVIRLILYPLSAKAVKTQIAMREIDPELKRLREELKDSREELARKTMALFKQRKVNPFASIFLILIQLPIIIGLYFVFLHEGQGLGFDPEVLYAFISVPTEASPLFLGLVDLTGKSIVLAVIVGMTQFINARVMMPAQPPSKGASFGEDFQRSMQLQMRYVFPVVIGVIAYFISAAVALYFLTSNLFSLAQELWIKRHRTTT